MFPLKVVGNEPILVTENTVLTNLNRREKQLRKYTAKELYEKTKRIEPTRAKRSVKSESYYRDPWVMRRQKNAPPVFVNCVMSQLRARVLGFRGVLVYSFQFE